MRPLPPRRALRHLVAAALATLAAAPLAAAAPAVDQVRAERDALAARADSLDARLAREHGALAGDRARLDRARRAHAAALGAVRRRLRALYVSPDPSPVIEVLTGGDLQEAQARIDLLAALGRADREMIAGYRSSVARLRLAEAEVRRDKGSLARERAEVGARLADAEARLVVAERRERARRRAAAAAAALPVAGGLSLTTSFGAPAAGDGDERDGGERDGGDPQPARGLPADLLAGRGLPGRAPRDAATGRAIDTEPVAAGPATTRAYPGIGVVGPASGAALPARLPTFTAVAGWYGPGFTRERTAGGEPYDPAAFSAASRTLRLGTLLRVAYGGRVVTVRVNDRGPYVRGRDLDLSQAAAAALGLPGVGTVTVQVLPGYEPPRRAA